MEDLTSFASIPAIMLITYYLSLFYKYYKDEDKQMTEHIFCGSIGLILGVLSYYLAPEVIHSDNLLSAIATGIASGLASITFQRIKR